MRAVSRLQLQMNRTQCPVWPFDFRFYCSSSSSSTYFSGYLLFSLQNNVFLYHFFHFYRFNTPYPPPLWFPGVFQMIPKQTGISLLSLLSSWTTLNLMLSTWYAQPCTKHTLKVFPCHFLFDANMLCLCSCVYKAHFGFFSPYVLALAF